MSAEHDPRNTLMKVKVHLLQDALYSEDTEIWTTLLENRTRISEYFVAVGLQLVVDDEDGFAYLRQTDTEDEQAVPRLFRRVKLPYHVTLLGVLLRERLLEFDGTVQDSSKLVVMRRELRDLLSAFCGTTTNETKQVGELDRAINRACDLGFLKRISDTGENEEFEVRRIVKAKFPAEGLQQLKQMLETYARSVAK